MAVEPPCASLASFLDKRGRLLDVLLIRESVRQAQLAPTLVPAGR